jgi:4-carboxymuconolactone decarboxylase
MADAPTNARKNFGDIAPALADYTDKVLFGDLWKRPNLSPRDRSLVTITALIALYRHNELPSHWKRAIENGVTRDEIVETTTQLAFCGGWPVAITALPIARKCLKKAANERHERSEANFGEIS